MSPSTEVADDVELLTRAQEGDRLAFADLYDRHVRPVYWQAYSVVHDAGEAEEVTQDVFVTAWRKIRAITPVDGSLLPWLLVTARYTALNAYRRASRRRNDALDDNVLEGADSPVEREIEAAQVRAEIDKAVAALAENDRRLYELCVEGDRTYEQAARELGVS
ncbi:RNA polymerase sigma factor, partial [Aeromicrobium sp.]|uniref:RNA polymerase sigma factor n=1 Tax=Aeromicrobium sp. TaxID=1871063 RepID=UPI003D6A3DD1